MDNLQDFNYAVSEHCKECNSVQPGIMYHAHDAAGLATPVLWACDRCKNPPMHAAVYRKAKRFCIRVRNKYRWYRLPRAEREARIQRAAEIKARIAARREARA